MFPYFFNDAAKILENKNNKIVIDDGRRFLERTSVKYDLVTIDPPPPVRKAAGSSLLYSEEFYKIIQEHLTANGILAQWYPEKKDATLEAVARFRWLLFFLSCKFINPFPGKGTIFSLPIVRL